MTNFLDQRIFFFALFSVWLAFSSFWKQSFSSWRSCVLHRNCEFVLTTTILHVVQPSIFWFAGVSAEILAHDCQRCEVGVWSQGTQVISTEGNICHAQMLVNMPCLWDALGFVSCLHQFVLWPFWHVCCWMSWWLSLRTVSPGNSHNDILRRRWFMAWWERGRHLAFFTVQYLCFNMWALVLF